MFAARSSHLSAFFVLSVVVTAAGCSKKQPPPDEQPVGVASLTPLTAPEEGDGPSARNLLPLQVGNRWTYQVTGTSATCTPGEHTRSILREVEIGGRQAFVSTGFCGADAESALSPEGSQILELAEGEWRTTLASSLVEGRTWDFTADQTYHWHKIGWVRVAAGLFPDCWERLPKDNYSSETFCDGVGMVAMSGSDLLVELKSFSLNDGARVSEAAAGGGGGRDPG